MKTYYSCGIAKEKEFLLDTSDFYIQEINLCETKQYTYSGDSIKYELVDELVLLYDTLRDVLLINSLEYYQEKYATILCKKWDNSLNII